jgi:hypothetical protein
MTGVRGQITVGLDLTDIGTNDLGSPKLRVTASKLLDLTAGTGATNQANILFSDQRTLAASANESLDLAGVLTNAFGATITAAEIVAIYVSAAAGNTNNVQISVPASNGFVGPFLAASDGYVVRPGEYALFVSQAGWGVTAGTGDLLNIANSGGTTGVTYDIIIVGRTTAA